MKKNILGGLRGNLATASQIKTNQTRLKKPVRVAIALIATLMVNEVYADETLSYSTVSSGEASASSYIYQIKADKVHAQGFYGSLVKVGVMDSGLDASNTVMQRELNGRIVNGYDYINNVSSDNTANGSIHGTMVANIIAASANGEGSYGVAPNAIIQPLRVLDANGYGGASVYNALAQVKDSDIKILNMSLGSSSVLGYQNLFEQMMNKDILIVAAAGNSGGADPVYPARLSGTWINRDGALRILAVGSVDSNNVISHFSNRAGVAKDFFLVAPGQSITTNCNTGLCTGSGTSFAAPMVSGAAALIESRWSYLTAAQTADILLRTATDLGATGTDEIYGRGLLNVEAAMNPVGNTYIKTDSGNVNTGDLNSITSPASGGAITQPNPVVVTIPTPTPVVITPAPSTNPNVTVTVNNGVTTTVTKVSDLITRTEISDGVKLQTITSIKNAKGKIKNTVNFTYIPQSSEVVNGTTVVKTVVSGNRRVVTTTTPTQIITSTTTINNKGREVTRTKKTKVKASKARSLSVTMFDDYGRDFDVSVNSFVRKADTRILGQLMMQSDDNDIATTMLNANSFAQYNAFGNEMAMQFNTTDGFGFNAGSNDMAKFAYGAGNDPKFAMTASLVKNPYTNFIDSHDHLFVKQKFANGFTINTGVITNHFNDVQNVNNLSMLEVSQKGEQHLISMNYALLNESNGALGSSGSSALGFGGNHRTDSVSLNGAYMVHKNLVLAGNFTQGFTRAKSNELTDTSKLISQSWSLGAFAKNVWQDNDQLALSISSPLAYTSGKSTMYSSVGVDENGQAMMGSQSFALTPDARELRLEAKYNVNLTENSKMSVNLMSRLNPGNDSSNDRESILMVKYMLQN